MSTIPRLTDRQSQLLSLYIQLGADIHAVIAAAGLSPTDALDWYFAPAVQAHLAAFEELAARSLAFRTSQSRLNALNTLEAVTRNPDRPTERLRAAVAVIRTGRVPSAPITRLVARADPSPASPVPSRFPSPKSDTAPGISRVRPQSHPSRRSPSSLFRSAGVLGNGCQDHAGLASGVNLGSSVSPTNEQILLEPPE